MNRWGRWMCTLLILGGESIVLCADRLPPITLHANESAPYWSEKLPYGGMGGEIVQAISKEMGMTTHIEFRPLKRMIADRTNNDLGNPLFYMENQDFGAIVPIAVTYSAVYTYRPWKKKKEALPIQNKTERRIGILRGTVSDPDVLKRYGSFEESYSHESLFKKLKAGRIDSVIELNLVGRKTIAALFPGETGDFDVQIIPESASPVAIMVDSANPDAALYEEYYRQGLHRILKNGVYRKIIEKYYGKSALPSDWYEQLSKFEALYAVNGTENGR